MQQADSAQLVSNARSYLEQFLYAPRRAKALYVQTDCEFGRGFFEPVLLSLCWSDFLGALYLGEPDAGNGRRITQWLRGPMRRQRPEYRDQAEQLYQGYRHGLVHGYEPTGLFSLGYGQKQSHLQTDGGAIVLDIPTLLEDLIASVEKYSESLSAQLRPNGRPQHGSIEAFQRSYEELLRRPLLEIRSDR